MKKRVSRTAVLSLSLGLAFLLTGCLGWGDMFAPRHTISGDYSLMQGEGGDDIYLFVKGASVSVAGPLHQIGWNGEYIIFTDANWPTPWNVLRVADHHLFKISQQQLQTDNALKGIALLSPSAAWNKKSR